VLKRAPRAYWFPVRWRPDARRPSPRRRSDGEAEQVFESSARRRSRARWRRASGRLSGRRLEVEAGVPQHAAGIGGPRQRLRALEAGKRLTYGTRTDGWLVISEFSTRTSRHRPFSARKFLSDRSCRSAGRCWTPCQVPSGKRGGEVVIAQVVIVGGDIAIAPLDVSLQGVGESGEAKMLDLSLPGTAAVVTLLNRRRG